MATLLAWVTRSPLALDHPETAPEADVWMENYTLFLTDAGSPAEANEIVQRISDAGGHVGVVIGRTMLGWIDPAKVEDLVGRHKIRAIQTAAGPVGDAAGARAGGLTEDEQTAVNFFAAVESGAYKSEKAAVRAQVVPPERKMLPDSRIAGRVSYADLTRNLAANGIDADLLKRSGITITQKRSGAAALAPGNSDYMVGLVNFNAIFIESAGGVDPNRYTWTPADRTTIQNEIIAGLSWWANTAGVASTYNTPLTFRTSFFYDSRTTTRYEPILHRSGDDTLWISEIMGKFGYTSGDKFARTTAFNTARRIATNANWAVTSFVGYNPAGAPTTFTDGYFAYAYLRGPYSQLLFANDGWGVANYDVVNAHESGHLFGAQDEYYQAGYGGCTSCGASTNGVLNGNCEFCNPNAIRCMMRDNFFGLCGYTPGQIGWRSLTQVSVTTNRQGTGALKTFFAQGERIQYRVNFCVTGPRLGTTTFPVYARARADFYGGSLAAPTTVADDTGWSNLGSVSPPVSTGANCYYAWWNRTVPVGVQFGPATVSGLLSLSQYGRGATSAAGKFYVAPYADTTEPAPPAAASTGGQGVAVVSAR